MPIDQKFRLWLIDTAEKAGSTLWQTGLAFFVAADAMDSSQTKALLSALIVALFNVLKNALVGYRPAPKSLWADMLVRVGWTFAIVLTGSVTATIGFDAFDTALWKQLLMAAGAAALSALKCLIASWRKGTISPASLVKG